MSSTSTCCCFFKHRTTVHFNGSPVLLQRLKLAINLPLASFYFQFYRQRLGRLQRSLRGRYSETSSRLSNIPRVLQGKKKKETKLKCWRNQVKHGVLSYRYFIDNDERMCRNPANRALVEIDKIKCFLPDRGYSPWFQMSRTQALDDRDLLCWAMWLRAPCQELVSGGHGWWNSPFWERGQLCWRRRWVRFQNPGLFHGPTTEKGSWLWG